MRWCLYFGTNAGENYFRLKSDQFRTRREGWFLAVLLIEIYTTRIVFKHF